MLTTVAPLRPDIDGAGAPFERKHLSRSHTSSLLPNLAHGEPVRDALYPEGARHPRRRVEESGIPVRTSKSLTARGAVTRARIVVAAAKLIYARGAGETSLEDVMQASGTSKSQIYHYFADKNAIIDAVIAAQTEAVVGWQATYLDAVDSLAGLRQWRNAFIKARRQSGIAGGCPIGSLASELAKRDEGGRELLAEAFRKWERALTKGLAAMRDRGELASAANLQDLATAILSALQGGILLTQTKRDARPLELALDMAITHVERAAPRRGT